MSGNAREVETELIEAETLKTRMKVLADREEAADRREVVKSGPSLWSRRHSPAPAIG